MKVSPRDAAPSVFVLLRNKHTGIVYSSRDCPSGRLDASHFIADHTCRCNAPAEPLNLFGESA